MKSSHHPPSFRWHLTAMLIVAATRVLAQTSPFEVKTDRDAGYPQITPNYFFEKVDALEKNPWRYSKVDQFEVLSRCSEAATKRFVAELGRRLQLMKSVVPAELLPSIDTPIRVFLFREDNTAQLEAWRLLGVTKPQHGLPFHLGQVKAENGFTVMVNLRPYESSPTSQVAEDAIVFAAAKLAHAFVLGQMRTESGPWLWRPVTAWLWNGLNDLCVELQPVSPKSFRFAWPPGAELSLYSQGRTLTREQLLPIESLFRPPSPSAPPNADFETIRRIQQGLFVRWGLLGNQSKNRETFWKFAAQARAHEVTEAQFHEYFGLSGVQIQKEVGDYLRSDLAPFPLRALGPTAINAPVLPRTRTATDAEIQRFKEAVNRAYDETRPRA